MKICIRKVQFDGPHTWKNTSPDRSVGLHFEIGNKKVSIQNSKIYYRSVIYLTCFLGTKKGREYKQNGGNW